MWRIRKNNLLVNEKDKLFVHKVHLERLLHAKTHIQNKGPDIPYFMRNNLSKREIMRVKERKRCYENSIIFSRLLEINKTFSPYSKIHKPKYCPAFDKKRHYFDKIEKQRDIYNHNQFLFNRLVNEKSFYPTKLLFKVNDYENYIRGNIKRQHYDNPNIKFASFNQFKKNIIRNYNYKRSNSLQMSRPTITSRNDGLIPDNNNYSNDNNGIEYNKSYNNIIRKDIKKNNNNNSFISTNQTSKMGRTMSRCQSALSIRNKKKYNF